MCRTNRQLGNKINSHQENALKRQQQAATSGGNVAATVGVGVAARCCNNFARITRACYLLLASWSCHRPFGWERARVPHVDTTCHTRHRLSTHTIIVATDDDAARYQQKLRFNCHVFMPHSPHLGARRLMPPQAATARCTLHLKLQQSSSAAPKTPEIPLPIKPINCQSCHMQRHVACTMPQVARQSQVSAQA